MHLAEKRMVPQIPEEASGWIPVVDALYPDFALHAATWADHRHLPGHSSYPQ